jgi:hypothetical protein
MPVIPELLNAVLSDPRPEVLYDVVLLRYRNNFDGGCSLQYIAAECSGHPTNCFLRFTEVNDLHIPLAEVCPAELICGVSIVPPYRGKGGLY